MSDKINSNWKRSALFLFTLLFAPTMVFGESISTEGFLSPSSSLLPDAIKKASQSVYRLTYPNGSYRVVPMNEKIEEQTKADTWLSFQYQVCKLNKLNQCPIYSGMWIATGFTAKAKNILSTNLHVVQNWLYQVKSANPNVDLKSLVNPIVVSRDQEGLLMPSPMEGLSAPIGQCRLSFYNNGSSPWETPYVEGTVAQRVSDYVELTCSQSFPGTILKISPLVTDNTHYLIGYPRETKLLTKYGGNDSNGKDLFISKGKPTNFEKAENLNVVFSNPGAPSSSGGPLVNESGEVVAILFSGTIAEENGNLKTESQLLRLDFDLMKTVWDLYAK